jgi:hypothetical protein
VLLPGIPLAQNEDAFAVAPLLDSPAGAMCDEGGGRVACYFAFRGALVPKASGSCFNKSEQIDRTLLCYQR